MTSKKLGLAAKARIKELQDQQNNREKYIPVTTGLIDLDTLLNGGLPRAMGFYISIIGREKKGKSTVGKQLFLAYCEETGLRGCIYDLEESVAETADRAMLMRGTRTRRSDIYNLRLTDYNFEELSQIADEIDEHETYVNDELMTLKQIEKDSAEFDVIAIDNFQLLTDGTGGNERERLQSLSKQLMKMRKAGKRIFLLAQGSPVEKSAFGSSQVLKDANVVILIEQAYEGEKKNKTPIEGMRILQVLLSRFSPTGECQVVFEGQFSRVRTVQTRKVSAGQDPGILNYEIAVDEEQELYTQGGLDDEYLR